MLKKIISKLFGALLIIWGFSALWFFNIKELGKLFIILNMGIGLLSGQGYVKNGLIILLSFIAYLILNFISNILFIESGIFFTTGKSGGGKKLLLSFEVGLLSLIFSLIFLYVQSV
jgi:uncharacterized membrane protein